MAMAGICENDANVAASAFISTHLCLSKGGAPLALYGKEENGKLGGPPAPGLSIIRFCAGVYCGSFACRFQSGDVLYGTPFFK
jgi:hypothetical protein